MEKPLVVTKYLIPGRRTDTLRRPRLIDFMHEHVDRKLVLVCAPAGYGKTSLLAEFAHELDLPLCWYTLDRSDRDLRAFVEYLLAAIRHRFPTFGSHTQALLASSETLNDPEALVAVLVNEIYEDIPDYFVVVLDDYHQVDASEPINYFLDSLLQHLPENCHLIVASRTIPTLTPRGLAVLTARQEVAGLGARELRFTPQEIQDLVRQNYGQALPEDVAQELARQSEGWITGILLTTQTAWKGLVAGVARARGADSSVYEYLASEVFALQTPEMQRFLLGSAVLEEMSAPRCDALLGIDQSARLLRQLEEGNIFIVRLERGDERWFRYHALFQGFLRERLAAEDPARRLDLHRRAAAIMERERDPDAAISHYLAAGDPDAAARVVLTAAEGVYEAGRLETLARWIDQLPAEIVARTAGLSLYRGRVYVEAGEYAHALECYDRARTGFTQDGDEMMVAQTLVDRGVSLRLQGRLQEATESCQEALSRMEVAVARPGSTGGQTCGQGDGMAGKTVAAGAHRNLGISWCQLGRVAEGTDELRQALQLYREAGSAYGLAMTAGDLGVALRLAGKLAASELHFEEALRLWQQLGHLGKIANALNSLAVGREMLGEHEQALNTFERALDYAQRAGSRRLQAFIWAGKGDVHLDMDRHAEALAAYNESWRLAEQVREPSLLTYLLNATAEVHRARGEYPQALALARRAYEQAQERGMVQDAARYEITLASLYLEQSNSELAYDYLHRALSTFARSGVRRELARVYLVLARVARARGDAAGARDELRQMAAVTLELGYDHFLVHEASREPDLLEAAVKAGAGGDLLADLARRARARRAQPQAQPQPAPAPAMPRLRIVGLGEAAVYVDDRPVTAADWGAAKARELFFYLLAFPSRRKEQIGGVLWPDLAPARLRNAFHVSLYRVRRALGMSDCVLYDNDQYYFNRQLDYTYDVDEFESLLNQAEAEQNEHPGAAEEHLERVLALYKGEYLEGITFANDEWCFWRREELARRYLGALQTLGQLRTARGDWAGALSSYRLLLARDPLREDIHRLVMRCLAMTGERTAALRHYQSLVALLQKELGVEPLPDTIQLQQAIASGQESLPLT